MRLFKEREIDKNSYKKKKIAFKQNTLKLR